jgi:hypothetical protein
MTTIVTKMAIGYAIQKITSYTYYYGIHYTVRYIGTSIYCGVRDRVYNFIRAKPEQSDPNGLESEESDDFEIIN